MLWDPYIYTVSKKFQNKIPLAFAAYLSVDVRLVK